MHSDKKNLTMALLFAAVLFVANVTPVAAFQTTLPAPSIADTDSDHSAPEVTAKVARISFLSGDAQVKRSDSQTWERAVPNLPLVEGDEVTTGPDTRLEIQFDTESYARIAENSDLSITTLRDEGIALSLARGRGAFRLLTLDPARAYFEIDAPGTTIAPQKAGMYDITTQHANASEVRVTVTEAGEARIYSESSGFLLKDGRSALLQIGGSDAGELDTARAETYADEFDTWSLGRDAAIAKAMRDAAYDKYYDRDIYGAVDLDGFGEWIYSKNYGYVWRPFSAATSSYPGWSPYRYGQWRWIPPFGWTWVNDEPWGWATYHHGRWFFDDGYWYWSPYGAYRNTRSWWSPALVYVAVLGGNVCWYPLPYSYASINFNFYYNHHNGGGHHGGGRDVRGGGPTPTPTPVRPDTISTTHRDPRPPLGIIPPNGVVSIPENDFGGGTKRNLVTPAALANTMLSRTPAASMTSRVLPTVDDVRQRGARDIITARPPVAATETAKTGAADRRPGAALDQDLRTTRIFGGRSPVKPVPVDTAPGSLTVRGTGAVERQAPASPRPVTRPQVMSTPEDSSPKYAPPVRQDPQNRPSTPKYEAPVRRDPPAPTSRPSTPKSDSPSKHDPAPVVRQPPAKSDPPPAKPQPKPEARPPLDTGKRDGV